MNGPPGGQGTLCGGWALRGVGLAPVSSLCLLYGEASCSQVVPIVRIGFRYHFRVIDSQPGKFYGQWGEGQGHAVVFVCVDRFHCRLAAACLPYQFGVFVRPDEEAKLLQLLLQSLNAVGLFNPQCAETCKMERYVKCATEWHEGLHKVGRVGEVVVQTLQSGGMQRKSHFCRSALGAEAKEVRTPSSEKMYFTLESPCLEASMSPESLTRASASPYSASNSYQ